ncbi:MAG: hypothetical protein IPL79_06330 [Myxococcales bacterium]|nr:hypothetical protein [Myxococcales bacterium]
MPADERLFSRANRRQWLTVLGGMIVIGIVNVVIGYLMWDDPPPPPPPAAFPREQVPGMRSTWPSAPAATPTSAPATSPSGG